MIFCTYLPAHIKSLTKGGLVVWTTDIAIDGSVDFRPNNQPTNQQKKVTLI